MLKDWLPQERRFEMVGIHSGLNADELWVPLIVATAQPGLDVSQDPMFNPVRNRV